MSRRRFVPALPLLLLALSLISLTPAMSASQNNPWNVAQGQRMPGHATPEPKESLYASVGAVLTQYELDVKDATLHAAQLRRAASKCSVCVAVAGSSCALRVVERRH